MNSLQRSSVSFRRQGSSGRIWDDRLKGLDLKGAGGAPPTTNAAGSSAPPTENSAAAAGENKKPIFIGKEGDDSPFSQPSSPSKPEAKAHRCAFSAVFRRCMGLPVS